MTSEEMEDLLRFRAKANLAKEPNSEFGRLEDYLFHLNALSTFSQEEREELIGQFESLSAESQQEITTRATNVSHPFWFYLSKEEVETLEAARTSLSLNERALLSDRLMSTRAGIAWIDLGKVFDAEVEIDDSSAPERLNRPHVYLSFRLGQQTRVETIDILESVRNNPASIGHPAVTFAICHWQHMISVKRVATRNDSELREAQYKDFKDFLSGEFDVRAAESHLTNISKALTDGAKRRAIPKEMALAHQMESLGLLEKGDTLLSRAWKSLSAKAVKKSRKSPPILSRIEEELVLFAEHSDARVSVGTMIRFLKDKGKNGGRRFVGYNEKGGSLRPKWIVFRNAFAAWHLGLAQGTVRDYLKKAKNQARGRRGREIAYDRLWSSPKTSIPYVWHYLLASPLIAARDPVLLSATDIASRGIAKSIEQATAGVRE